MTPELDDWTTWKTHCARALCTEETQHRLGRFARSRFGIQLRRQLTTTHLSVRDTLGQLPSAEDAWHHFESYAALTQTRQGKRYKDWIFARVQQSDRPPLDTIQSGATLIMRAAVRRFLRNEYARHGTICFDQPIGDGHLTLGDLLPDTANPADNVAAKEYATLASTHAKRILESLSHRQRVGLLAKCSGISLNQPDVLAAAGCKHSTLSQTVRDLLVRVRKDLRREYSGDAPNTVVVLSTLVVRHLEKCIYLWRDSEKGLPRCFYSVEDQICVMQREEQPKK